MSVAEAFRQCVASAAELELPDASLRECLISWREAVSAAAVRRFWTRRAALRNVFRSAAPHGAFWNSTATTRTMGIAIINIPITSNITVCRFIVITHEQRHPQRQQFARRQHLHNNNRHRRHDTNNRKHNSNSSSNDNGPASEPPDQVLCLIPPPTFVNKPLV